MRQIWSSSVLFVLLSAALWSFDIRAAFAQTAPVFARGSFMQVEPVDARAAFRYYGIDQQTQTVYRGGYISYNFWSLVEGYKDKNDQYIDVSKRYYLDATDTSSVAQYSIFTRTRPGPNFLRTELVQVFNLTNGASVVLVNSFFNTTTNLTLTTWDTGVHYVEVDPIIAKLTLAIYNWTYINQTKNNLYWYFGLEFNIFQSYVPGSNGFSLSLPTISGWEPNSPASEFVVEGRFETIEYRVVLLKFGIDINSTTIGLDITARDVPAALASVFLTTPPVLKFNLTMKVRDFQRSMEYDPNFLLLLGDPTVSPINAPASPAQLSVDGGLGIGAIVGITLVAVAVVVAVIVIGVMQRNKFSMRIRVPALQNSGGSPPSTTKPTVQQQTSRWKSFSVSDAQKNSQLRNTTTEN